MGSGPWTLQALGRSLAVGATDTYVLTVRLNINRGNSTQTTNDTCGSPNVAGLGLYNNATAVMQGINGNPNQPFSNAACTNTPTPVWVILNKNLVQRISATDQIQIRILSGGIVTATGTATTSGTVNPTTAATPLVVLTAGNTMNFSEAIKTNGSGADISAVNY